MEKKDYIKWIRSKVGHERIILSFAGGCVFNDKGEVLLGRRADYKVQKAESKSVLAGSFPPILR